MYLKSLQLKLLLIIITSGLIYIHMHQLDSPQYTIHVAICTITLPDYTLTYESLLTLWLSGIFCILCSLCCMSLELGVCLPILLLFNTLKTQHTLTHTSTTFAFCIVLFLYLMITYHFVLCLLSYLGNSLNMFFCSLESLIFYYRFRFLLVYSPVGLFAIRA